MKEWMIQQLPLVIPKSPLGQAIAYTLPRWKGLSGYALHGQIEIDNSLAENAIRPWQSEEKHFVRRLPPGSRDDSSYVLLYGYLQEKRR